MSSQATLAANQATFQANFMALTARTDERSAEIRAILLRHEQMLQSLPEALRQRIGFESR